MSTGPSPADQLRRTIDLLWGKVEQRPSRGPRPSLSLDQIVDAAIAVADAGGIEALSMRRVAAELGAGTMSLYRHVPGKPELLALMLERISDPWGMCAHARGKPWREVLELVARGGYRMYLDHPWLLQVNWTRPVLGQI
jgi:AcrR family transcriptional regulator